MIFKLGIVGHNQSLQELKDLIIRKFPNVEAVPIVFDNDECTAEAVDELRKQMPGLNGVLYTRRDPFKLVSRVLEHNIPVSYAEIDGSTLTHSLLEAVYRFHADISKISVDSLDYGIITDVYKSLGIPTSNMYAKYVSISTDADHYVQRVAGEHRRNFKNKNCSICITNVRTVLEQLTSENIPCVLLTPSAESFAYEIRKLIVGHSIRKTAVNQNVIVSFSMSPRNNFFAYNRTIFQEYNECSRILEKVSILAQRVNGAMLINGSSKCLLICKASELEHIWEQYAKINVLKFAELETSLKLAIGVGYGKNLRTAQVNSGAALLQAVSYGQCCAFVVYNANNIIGPIGSPLSAKRDANMFSLRLSEISRKSGISINTIFKIDEFLKRGNTKFFSSATMAQELGISIRTANRIIDKLLYSNIIEETGRYVVGEKGRPTRMFQFVI